MDSTFVKGDPQNIEQITDVHLCSSLVLVLRQVCFCFDADVYVRRTDQHQTTSMKKNKPDKTPSITFLTKSTFFRRSFPCRWSLRRANKQRLMSTLIEPNRAKSNRQKIKSQNWSSPNVVATTKIIKKSECGPAFGITKSSLKKLIGTPLLLQNI